MANHLQKITTRAKQLRKASPGAKWTNLVKKAAAQLRTGKKKPAGKKVSGVKKVHHKKTKTMAKGRTVVVAGHKKRTTKKRVSGIRKHMHMSVWDAVKMSVGGGIGGSAAAILYKFMPGHGVLKGGLQYGAGLAGMVMSGNKHPFVLGITNGIATAGFVNVAHGAGVISGVEEMVSGLFDGMGGNDEMTLQGKMGNRIPINTAGNQHHNRGGQEGLEDSGYVGMTRQQIDSWVKEGIPGLGAEDWQ